MKNFYFTLIFSLLSLSVLGQGTPTGSSTEVGVTQGQLTVSLSGAANYTIPIKVPPGINGVEPKINLSYNSQSGNGSAGYGWSISGVSTITRIPSTKFHNGNVGTINYNLSDNYALDGQRLIVKNGGIYGKNGTVYETENYSNIKVTSYGAVSSVSDIGPEYFVVEYPDGSKAYYGYITGNNSNSRSAIHYAITYWENAQGVRINYYYTDAIFDKLNLTSIKYGNINTSIPPNEINFTYKNRFKVESQLIGGQLIRDAIVLSDIKITTSSIGFRNYTMTYDLSSLGYERLNTITEKTGDNSKSLNPTVFSYAENQTGYSPSMELSNTSSSSFWTDGNGATLTGDFDGDGENELLIKKNGITVCEILDDYSVQNVSTNSLSSLGLPTGEFPSGIINVLDKDLKIPKNQSFYTVDGNLTDIEYKIFNYNSSTNKVEFDYERTFHSDIAVPPSGEQNQNTGGTFLGDFNGDNLTDLIRIHPEVNGISQVEFLNFDRRLTSDFVTNIGTLDVGVKTFKLVPDVSNGLAVITGSSIFYKGDINGDGKMDLILFRGAPYNDIKVYTLINNSLVEIIKWQHNLPGDIGSSFFQVHAAGINTTIAGTGIQRFPIVIGDYNGDGKSDILFVSLRKVLIATGGKYFLEELLPDSFPALVYPYSVSFIPVDTNNDGKSDIVRIEPKTTVYEQKYTDTEQYESGGVWYVRYVEKSRYFYDHGIKIDSYYRPGINSASWNNFGFEKILSTYKNDTDPSDDNVFNYNILANIKKKNPLKTELVLIGAFNNIEPNKISVFSCNNYISDQHLIKSITLGNGVKENIIYSPLKNGNGVYEAGNPQLYPNLSIQLSPEFKVVSQIDYPNNAQSKKIFKYFGAVMNVEGLGFLGFQATMRTNIHNDSAPVVSTVSKNDFLLRGANVENYSVAGLALPSAATPTSFISKSTLGYNSPTDALQSNKVFKLKNTSSIQFDGLTNISNETTTDYDSYNNPLKVTTLVKDGVSTVQKTVAEAVYQNPTTTPHIVGRPESKIKTVSYNGDVATSEEVYSYNPQQLLSQVKKRADATTSYVTEDNTYDLFGNIISKKITAGANSRTASWAYDTSGRFLTSKTDIQLLPTTYTYYPNGTLKTEKNPYGQTSTYEYDSWFRKIKTTDYLQNTITYDYAIDSRNNRSVLTAVSSDGTATSDAFDELGRKVNESVKANVNGYSINKNYTYDVYGRVVAEGVPYKAASIRQSQKIYDVYGRVIQQISPTDLRANITYSGLTSTVDDGSKTKKITKDAVGNVIEVNDSPGGIIKYSYYANGNLKETDFDGTKTTILQDKWGRKTQLQDPSAGLTKYTYNDFNELIQQENSNGITNYKVNATGRLEEKTVTGTNTNSKTTYTYNSLNQISGSEFVDTWNGGNKIINTYFYDSWNRNDKITEVTPYASFTKAFTYDGFGRIDTEASTAKITSSGKSSTKTLKNTYQNGSLYQIKDGTTVLSQMDAISDNGALGSGTFGNGIKLGNTYDGNGYSTSKECWLGTTSLIKLETSFDIEKGNLKSRKTNLFDYPEEFKYDPLDRLTDIITLGQFLNNTFTTSDTEGYLGENVSGISSSGGALSVQVSNAGGALKKTLLTGAKLGDAITLTFDLRKILGSDAYNVYIQEQDPVSLATVKYLKATFISASTTYTLNHTVTQYTNVILRIEKVNTTSLNVFIIDNVVGKGKIAALQGYDAKGRITSNDLGTYNYPTSGKVYQNSSVDLSTKNLPYYQSRPTQIVTYTAFNSPYQIEDTGVEKVSFDYNDNSDRSTMFYGGLQDKLLRPYRKYYSGDGTMEIKENRTTGAVEFITYIGGDGYSAPVVFKSDGGSNQNYLYLHRDYQGSIVAISNQAGAIVEKRLFDAWGNSIKVLDGAGNTLAGLTLLDRGYTGHEHLQSVGIIHMNGRLYDPKLRRFLEADNNIQDPFNTQNYNRYGYVLNNPLKYTDPTGEFWNVIVGYLFAAYVQGAYASGGELNPAKWNSSAIVNIGARGLSFGASTVATNFTNNYLDNYNRPPELGISAIGEGYNLHAFVKEKDNVFNYSNNASIANGTQDRNTVSSLISNSTFVGISYALGKFEDNVDRVGDLRNFKIQNYHPANKYDFIISSGITDGKVYIQGTKSSTSSLKYLGTTAKFVGYGASAFTLKMSFDEYLEGKIPGSVLALDIGMTIASYQGGYGAGISAFYFMGVRNTPDYFEHKPINFKELREVQIDNTRVRN